MPSLNKIKPGTGAVAAFVAKNPTASWLLTEKLDGISALWIPAERSLICVATVSLARM
jgi:hypothetical protein